MSRTEIIKPASPTPPHLRLLHLSSLDLLAPTIYVPLIFYYPSHHAVPSPALLKTSLSQCLVRFYPLAGRFAGDRVDCNDQGVEFVESRVESRLQDLIHNPNEEALTQLVPCRLTSTKSAVMEGALLAVQANFFDCGGLALGVDLCHCIGDMASFATFLKAWAATARNCSDGETDSEQHHQQLVRHGFHLFPPTRPSSAPPQYKFPTRPDPVMKSFALTDANIAALRRSRGDAGATRVEAITALVCRCIARAAGNSSARVFLVSHAVNLRPRTEPPLPDDAFGNLSVVRYTPELAEEELVRDMHGRVEAELRKTIKKVDGQFVREMQRMEWFNRAIEPLLAAMEKHGGKEEVVYCAFSSWCKFGLYEVDFGWGRPQWVSPAPMPFENICVLLDGRDGDGIEAWVWLDADVMTHFQQDQELLSLI